LSYAFESAQYPLGEWAYEQGVALSKNISKPDHEVLSLMYLLFARLCGEMSRAQEGLAASIQAEKHILIAAKTKPGLLKTGQYSRILTNLGIMHTDLGNWDEALKWHNRAVENCIQLGKQKEFSLGNLRQNLAGTYLWKGDLQRAEGIVRLALTEPNTSPMGATFTLGNVLWKQKRIEEALEVHKQTLLDYSASLGASHPVTANSWLKMGTLLQTPGHPGFDLEESEYAVSTIPVDD
jgi:tetratricopeptide (TPR) repeat protein